MIILAKTDKELTTEIVNTFVSSWNSKNNTQVLNSKHLIDLIQTVHKTIRELPDDKNDSH